MDSVGLTRLLAAYLPSCFEVAGAPLERAEWPGSTDVWTLRTEPDEPGPHLLIDVAPPGPEHRAADDWPRLDTAEYPGYVLRLRGEDAMAYAVDGRHLKPLASPASIPWPAPVESQPTLFEGQRSAASPSGVALDAHAVAAVFRRAHDLMRDGDGLQPQEALAELLKALFVLLDRARVGAAPPVRRVMRRLGGSRRVEARTAHAQRIRSMLCEARRRAAEGDGHAVWLDDFELASVTLSRVVETLIELDVARLSLDLKSAALGVFLVSTLRRGLGIYLTPDPIVRMMVDALAPPLGAAIIDPACGTGSFLLHTLSRWHEETPDLLGSATRPMLFGVERNAHILRIAEVNLAPLLGASFRRAVADALLPLGAPSHPPWLRRGGFDYVLTNPPFGVTVEGERLGEVGLRLADARLAGDLPRIGSELLFIERSLELLAPGGILGIVLPNSVISNRSSASAREILDEEGALVAVVSLPPETFATTGTHVATSVLFFRRRPRASTGCSDETDPVPVYHAVVDNVGYDATGRPRSGSQLPRVTRELRRFLGARPGEPDEGVASEEGEVVGGFIELPASRPLSRLSDALIQSAGAAPTHAARGGLLLKDCATVIRTGRTPSRSSYVDEGHFIVKVGNLTNAGIDWFPRSRNHVSRRYVERLRRGRVADEMFLQTGDILLTSSAHSVKYIAKKVDLVDSIPSFVDTPVTFVGEVMLIRPTPEVIDPFFLLAYLRSRGARRALQQMIRGQTAHLMPNDAEGLWIPAPSQVGQALADDIVGELREELASRADSIERRARIHTMSARAFGALHP